MIRNCPTNGLNLWMIIQIFYAGLNFAYVESSKFSMQVDHEKNASGAGYIVELIHDATENYYEEEHMLVGLAIISSFLSMWLKS